MNALILAAGYATRMGTMALDRPKALLPVGGRPVLEYLVEALRNLGSIDSVSLVTNRKFVGAFRQWAADRPEWNVQIIDDGTTSNEQRRGAIGDLGLAIGQQGIESDLLVAGADNIFMLSFSRFVRFFAERQTDCITSHREDDIAKLRKTGVIEMDENGRVLFFEEKPDCAEVALRLPAALYLQGRDVATRCGVSRFRQQYRCARPLHRVARRPPSPSCIPIRRTALRYRRRRSLSTGVRNLCRESLAQIEQNCEEGSPYAWGGWLQGARYTLIGIQAPILWNQTHGCRVFGRGLDGLVAEHS